MPIMDRRSRTNARVVPQERKSGCGLGRRLFPWKKSYPWLVMVMEQVCVSRAGSEADLLVNRAWGDTWGITPSWLRAEVGRLFPGLPEHLDRETADQKTPWPSNLKNRVYKMYYAGTSDKGVRHDPKTRASVSREHWRNWPSRVLWEDRVMRIARGKLVLDWSKWL